MKKLSLALIACVVSTSAIAELGAGARIGTTGFGVDLGYSIFGPLSARVGYSYGSYKFDYNATDVNYDAKIKLSSINLFLDYTLLPGIRLTGGLIPQQSKVTFVGVPKNNTYTIGGTTYTATDVGNLNGSIKPGNSVAPYLGIGYGTVAGAGVNFYADLGVQYVGSPKVSVTGNCGPALNATVCNTLQADIQRERVRVENDAKDFKWYPVINVGVTVGF
jgi:hypothetical protein